MEHTPGPWEVDLDFNVRVKGKPNLVAIVKPVGHGISGNAHLIATAPELLHVLERFVAGIAAHADDATRKTLSYHMGNMKAVIAKAKGDT